MFPKLLVVESRHSGEIGGECFTLSGLKLLDEGVHGLLDEYLRGISRCVLRCW
jgi:hypothetical protein